MPSACTVTVTGHVQEWPEGLCADLPASGWLAVLARPRQDKLLVAGLRSRGIPGVMLYERRTRRYPRKGVQEYLVPLLGSWAFVNGADRDRVWAVGRCARVLPVVQEGRFVRELGDLVGLLRRSGAPPVVAPGLVAGTRVRVVQGAMAGLCGVVVRQNGPARLVVNLTALGTNVSVELPAEAAVDLVALPQSPA